MKKALIGIVLALISIILFAVPSFAYTLHFPTVVRDYGSVTYTDASGNSKTADYMAAWWYSGTSGKLQSIDVGYFDEFNNKVGYEEWFTGKGIYYDTFPYWTYPFPKK